MATFEPFRQRGGDVKQLKVDDLEIHPFNMEVYGEPDAGLAENIDNFGLQTPIKVDPDGRILSGARRWTAVKELGWDEIPAEVPDVDFDDDRAVQLYVLIANAYRKQKTSYQQKKEADAYRRLLSEGEVTKDDLREIAEDRDCAPPDHSDDAPQHTKWHDDKPSTLAARAAGMSSATYGRYRYLTDGGAEADIDEALDRREIAPDQAESIRSEAHDLSEKVKRDEVGVRTADNKIRDKIREAKKDHSLNPEERAAREAEEAVEAVRKKGQAYIAALERLFMDHRDALDGEMALVIASTFQEHRGLLQEQLPGGFLTDGQPSVEGEREPIEVAGGIVD